MTGVKLPISNFLNSTHNNLFYSSANYQCASTSAFLPSHASTPYYTSSPSASSTLSPSYLPDSIKNQFLPFWNSNNNNSSFSSDEASMSKFEPQLIQQYSSFKNVKNYNDLAKNAGKKKNKFLLNK